MSFCQDIIYLYRLIILGSSKLIIWSGLNAIQIIINRHFSGSYSFRISWEKRGVSDVFQSTIKHDNSLKSDSSSSVGISPVFEALDIIFDCFGIDSLLDGSFFKNYWVMDSLGST